MCIIKNIMNPDKALDNWIKGLDIFEKEGWSQALSIIQWVQDKIDACLSKDLSKKERTRFETLRKHTQQKIYNLTNTNGWR